LAQQRDLRAICHSLEPRRGEPLLLLVNGFGGTPLMELYVMYRAAASCARPAA
jgi:dihydroxyacetone kinase-like protein